MSTLPAAGYLTNAARTVAEEKTAFDDLVAAIKQIPGAGIAETTLTIAAGSVTPGGGVGGIFSIDTEGAAATDDLTNIVPTNFPSGSVIRIRPVAAARLVVVKHSAGGSGQISLTGLADFTLRGPTNWMDIKVTGTTWEEVAHFGSPETLPIAAAGGTVDAITATFNPAIALVDKALCAVVSAGASTSATPTFAPNGLTAHTIVKNGGVALVAGDIGPAGMVMLFEYNLASTRWELLNPVVDYATGTFTGTLTGGTTSPTVTIRYARVGKLITLTVNGDLTVTSNSTSKTITGMPSAPRPGTALYASIPRVQDNGGTFVSSGCVVGTDGVITIYPTAAFGLWTASGTASIDRFSISYSI